MEKEHWEKIKSTEGLYEVSSLGNIRKTKSGIPVKHGPDFLGYDKVGLYLNGKTHTKTVHRLVAEAFIPNPDDKPQVHHINGDKLDNRKANLMWCTPVEHGKMSKSLWHQK